MAHIFPTTKRSNRKKNIKVLIKRKLEVKLPTIWTAEKAEVGRDREEKRREERKPEKRREEKKENQRREEKKENQRRERVRRKKMQAREKSRKNAKHCVFQCFVAPEGRKVYRLVKATGAEPSA